MKMKNQRLMTFSDRIDVTEAKGEHKFYLKFTKEFIRGKKVLNVGSWTGPYEIIAAPLVKKMTAVDIEGKALKVLKKNIPEVEVVKAFAHNLPFKDSTFEVVTLFDVIEHIPEGYELATMKEISRVLKKNGYFFLATPHNNFLSKLFDPAYWFAKHRHYSTEQLKQMMHAANFSVEKFVRVGSFFSSFYALSFYFFKHILRMKLPTIKYVENKMERDISSPGYIQVVIRAKKLS